MRPERPWPAPRCSADPVMLLARGTPTCQQRDTEGSERSEEAQWARVCGNSIRTGPPKTAKGSHGGQRRQWGRPGSFILGRQPARRHMTDSVFVVQEKHTIGGGNRPCRRDRRPRPRRSLQCPVSTAADSTWTHAKSQKKDVKKGYPPTPLSPPRHVVDLWTPTLSRRTPDSLPVAVEQVTTKRATISGASPRGGRLARGVAVANGRGSGSRTPPDPRRRTRPAAAG
jgi:hypothetical protein